MAMERLKALRALMAAKPLLLEAYIVPTQDAHNSEYIAKVDARREWLSGFTGSAGTAVVLADKALVWTDGRYYTQFEQEADLGLWTLMKQSLPETPSIEAWLAKHLKKGATVGVDPKTMSRQQWKPILKVLTNAEITLKSVERNLVDEVRVQLQDPSPPRPTNAIITLPLKYTGKSAGEKVNTLREKMKDKKTAALVISALDEVAWTLNLRGSDIAYNPVFFAYLVVRPQAVVIFWHTGALDGKVLSFLKEQGLADVECRPYSDVFKYLEDIAMEVDKTAERSVWLSHDGSEALHASASGGCILKKPLHLLSEVSPVAVAKSIKNDKELEGMRQCHIRDGTALVRFLRWLHNQMEAGQSVTEVQAGDRLEVFRSEEKDFMGLSFSTIAGAGSNGAIIHYSASRDGPQRVIRPDDIFLLDSGGQYRDGTTDITRTRHMSARPSDAQRNAFTRVLKGQIMMGNAIFPRNVKGNVLDTLARKALWDVGLNYAHGTGHGVGSFLNVHEGPSGISWRPYPDDQGLQPGMIFSNEPGYYEVGSYGIRLEDLVETIAVTKDTDHMKAKGLLGDFDGQGALGFRTISLAPHQRECIDVNLLDEEELAAINGYHARVLSTLGPVLTARGLTQDLEWLRRECAPLERPAKSQEGRTVNASVKYYV